MSTTNLWIHHQPIRIYSGPLQDTLLSSLKLILTAEQTKPHCCIALITTAGFTKRGVTAKLAEWLYPLELLVMDEVTANPDIDTIDSWINHYSLQPVAAVIGLGGGSAMDAAKAIAVMQPLAKTESSPLNKLFREKSIKQPNSRLPLLLIPTTAGTGSEVTPFATIWDNRHKKKYSLSGPSVYPDAALLDASLTLSLPPDETLYSGLDALSHSLESLWNKNRTPVSEAYSRQAFRLIVQALSDVLDNPADIQTQSRTMMQQASLLAGLAIATTRTAVAHSMSYPLTSHYQVPHGIACSYILPGVLQVLKQNSESQFEYLLDDLYEPAMQLLAQLPIMAKLENYVQWPQIEALLPEMDAKQRSGNFIMPVDAALLQRILVETHAFYNKC